MLQEKNIERVGGIAEIPIDVRVLSATNAPLEDYMKTGEFRPDLFYRLKGIELTLAPLRERKDEFNEIFNYFYKKICLKHGQKPKKISEDILCLLQIQEWPGNFRELQSFVEVLIFLTKDESHISLSNFPKDWLRKMSVRYEKIKKEPIEKRLLLIQSVIDLFKGNISAAAHYLDIDRTTLYRIVNQGKLPQKC